MNDSDAPRPQRWDRPARVVETHVSVVFFAGDRVFKLKKPMQTGFLDFRTREQREAVCRREVELNRRLAPDVYLGVANVVDDSGVPYEHLVVMRRLPDDRRLATLVTQGVDGRREIEDLAHLLASFHGRAVTGPEVERAASADAVLENWRANLGQMRGYRGTLLPAGSFDRVERLATEFVEGRRPLFRARIEEGWARDGHGDLLADDIFCLDDGPRVLDCIEFDDRLRYGDALSDVAFLAMDLERLGRIDLADFLLERYQDDSGEHHPASLAHHYVAYRAHVRSKVACLRHDQGDEQARSLAGRLHDMTLDHLERGRVVLVVVGGLPGTGKSTLSQGLAARRGWTVLRSDEIRKELARLPPSQRAPERFREGLYSNEHTDATYRELLRRASLVLEHGESVALDASWTAKEHRRAAAEVAEQTRSRLVELECTAPEAAAAERLATRASDESGISDATPEIARAMRNTVDPWPESVSLDSTMGPDALEAAADAAVDRAVRSD